MSTRVIIGIIAFCVAMTGVVLGNMFTVMMIGEVNRKRPDRDQVSYFGWTLPKMVRVLGEYRRSYPDGKVHIYMWASVALMAIGMIVFGVCARIIG